MGISENEQIGSTSEFPSDEARTDTGDSYVSKLIDNLGSYTKLEGILDKLTKDFSQLEKKVAEIDKKFEKAERRFEAAEFRSIEVVGIISSVIALVLVFVNIASGFSDTSLKSAYAILVTIAAILVLFASLLHSFFDTSKKSKSYYFLVIGLPILIIIVIGLIVTGLIDFSVKFDI